MTDKNTIWPRDAPAVGQKAELTREVLKQDTEMFTFISGDYNPLHYDEELAKATKFGGIIVQGGVTSAVLNAVVAEKHQAQGRCFCT
jgi:acyl dehydratase